MSEEENDIKKEVGFVHITTGSEQNDSAHYGSTTSLTNDEEFSGDVESLSDFSSIVTNRLSFIGDNIGTTVRHLADHYNGAQLVASHSHKMQIITDPVLDARETGSLYYAESSFYHMDREPEYALTVNPNIYQRIFSEVHDAKQIPLGLYFCCRPTHSDRVDIRVAHMFLAGIVVAFWWVAQVY